MIELNLNQKDESADTQEKVETSSMSKLLNSVGPSQCWKVLCALGVTLSVIFTLGFKMSSYIRDAQEARKDVEIQKLRQELERERVKNRVASKIKLLETDQTRFFQAKKAVEKSPANKQLRQDLKRVTQDYARNLESAVGSDKDEAGVADVEIERSEKSREESRVKFRDVPETYAVPKPVMDATKHILWHKTHGTSSPKDLIYVFSKRGSLGSTRREPEPALLPPSIEEGGLVPTQNKRLKLRIHTDAPLEMQ